MSELVPAFKETLTDPEEILGADIVEKALASPLKIIAENSGIEGEVVAAKVYGKPFEYGYDALKNTYTNLVEAGVIDPAKVTRSGITNSAGIAGILLTTQAVLAEKKIPRDKIEGGFTKEGLPTGMTI